MRILLTGATGQVGRELAGLLNIHQVIAPSRTECDLSDPASIRQSVREANPAVIINPAAYTAVDKAEEEVALAHAINATAPAVLAEEARKLGVPLIHFSTDYVFDGTGTTPYTEDQPTNPINVYGRTKLDGEHAIRGSGCIHLILRTSWVYSRHGRNFLLTIERLARERSHLKIVSDQRGTPNWARELGRVAVALAGMDADELSTRSGIYHLSSQGETTWHGFAQAIVASMQRSHTVSVEPIPTQDFPTPAKRPSYSVLDTTRLTQVFGLTLPDWRESFTECQRECA